jgi:hypothetical protein
MSTPIQDDYNDDDDDDDNTNNVYRVQKKNTINLRS